MFERIARAGVLGVMASVSGCGGGGGGGSSGNPTPPPPAALTFTVGGSISGLAGSAVLQNNGGNDLTVTADGNFVFTTAIANGGAYVVSVRTAPASPPQSCALSNATGSISGANVSNVTVTCSLIPLALQSSTPANGATTVDRHAAPSLTFTRTLDGATAVAGGFVLSSQYGSLPVTVSASGASVAVQPSAALLPATNYSLTADAGLRGAAGERLPASVSLSFSTRDLSQGAISAVSTAAFATLDAKVAVTGSGDAVAGWSQSDGTRYNLYARYFTAASNSWDDATLVETDDRGSARQAVVGADSAGNFIALWQQYDGAKFRIWSSHRDASTGWTAPAQVNFDDTNADALCLSVGPDGKALGAWTFAAGSGGVEYRRYSPDTGWTSRTEVIVSGNTASGCDAALSAHGEAFIAVRMSSILRNAVMTFVDRPGQMVTYDYMDETGDGIMPSVAADGAGNAMVVWSRYTAPNYQVYSRRYVLGAGWAAMKRADFLDRDQSYYPNVVLDAQGDGVVVWRESDGTRARLFAANYDHLAGAWGVSALIETTTAGDASVPQLTMNSQGMAQVLWAQGAVGADANEIRTVRRARGEAWRESTVEAMAPGFAAPSGISMNESGTVHLLWSRVAGVTQQWWARFD